MAGKPSIIAFSGHMTDAPDRPTPRFPEDHVPEVRKRMRAVLERERRPLFGVSSAARGGDLIFIEALLALDGRAEIFLPFPAADFKQTSVGLGWDAVFERVLTSNGVELHPPLHAAAPQEPSARDAAFAECNERIVQRARALASELDVSDPLFVALHKHTGTDLVGGTMDAFERWKKTGGRLEIIEP
ncbi:MAG TPA: hypothetical protein VJR89_23025 [Polyangiales bacterium]|nr:hypothetical protein [Polyangiales bacterium]